MRIDNLYLVGKMFKNVSLDSVRSGKFGCPVLSGQETHMTSPVEPYVGFGQIKKLGGFISKFLPESTFHCTLGCSTSVVLLMGKHERMS